MLNENGFSDAVHWLQQSGLVIDDLDSDAKAIYIAAALDHGQWDYAINAADGTDESDFERSPALLLLAAHTFLIRSVPDELRSHAIQYVPLPGTMLPLGSRPSDFKNRHTAIQLYSRMQVVAKSLGMVEVADIAGDKALWLRLMDPNEVDRARDEFEESLKDPPTFLRRLGLAIQCDIDIDIARAEAEVDRYTNLSGGMSYDAALARFALVLAKDSPMESASYVDKHRAQLLQHLDWRAVYSVEMEVLAKAGQITRAELQLDEAINKGFTEGEVFRIRRMFAEVSGGDMIAERLAAYETSQSIVDLRLLVEAFVVACDWENASLYGRMLLERTGAISDARSYVTALYNIEQLDELLSVFDEYPTLVDEFEGLRLLRAQTLYEKGNIRQAEAALQTLRKRSDSVGARQLQIQLTVVSGDWEALQAFVEGEWKARASRTPLELLQAGQIAQQIGAVRGQQLVREAARRSSEDPTVLVGCYHAATVAGWEDGAEVHQWIERAADLSEDDGPVQRVTIADVVEATRGWSERESRAWDLLKRGEIPIFLAADMLKRPQLSLYLVPALTNLDEPDVRKQEIVYSYSGARSAYRGQPKVVGMDVTALITAEFLNIFGHYVSTFDEIVIPHRTLAWLFNEKARIRFHQPSRIAAATELRQMLANGYVEQLEPGGVAPESLVNEVGQSLAILLAEACSNQQTDSQQRLVVIRRPIYKPGVSMREEAKLDEYDRYLCSMGDVLDRLVQTGILTAQEASEARIALSLHEAPWKSESTISDNAILYLDDVVVSHFQRLGLLSKLYRANMTPVISPTECEEADALIAYDSKSEEVISIVERLRVQLRKYLNMGKVRLGTADRNEEDANAAVVPDAPTISILKLIDEFDVAVIDDRFVNQHPSMVSETSGRPIITSLDVLDLLKNRGTISEAEFQNAVTKLRNAGFSLIPVAVEELTEFIAKAPVSDDVLVETAELRAIRHSVERIRMRDVLQLPKEYSWLISVSHSCLLAIREIWKADVDITTIAARSNWLLELGDVRGWIHRTGETPENMMDRYCMWVLLLALVPAGEAHPQRESFWRWLDARLLRPLREEDPDSYRLLVQRSNEMVTLNVEACLRDLENVSE